MSDEITLSDLAYATENSTKLKIHTSMPARVVSFNSEENTVRCELMISQIMDDGSYKPLPVLADVLVQYPRGGGFCLTFPLNKGDEGLAVFSERCIDGWWESGDISAPLDFRSHDLSDASFIAGISSRPKAIKNIRADAIVMRTDSNSAYFSIDSSGIIEADGSLMRIKCPLEADQTVLAKGQLSYQNGLSGTQGNGVQSISGTLRMDDAVINGVRTSTHKHMGNGQGNLTGGQQ